MSNASENCGVLSCGRDPAEKAIPISQIGVNAKPAAYRGHCFNGARFLCCEECKEKYSEKDGIRFERLAT